MANLLRVPAPNAGRVEVRFALVDDRDSFDPPGWRHQQLSPSAASGHFEINLDGLGLGDGVYEYEFVIDGDEDAPVADPFAEEISRFGGYRGLFRMAAGVRVKQSFSWANELPAGVVLPQNNELVICEIPMRWMTGRSDELDRQVGLGTFERYLFERLDELVSSHVNAIELLPVADSPDSINWGYGTRFFFAPDVDLGGPVDLKLLIKRCHQRGIRVLLDVVMNHSKECPLQQLADDWFYLRPGSTEEGERDDWGGRLFRYRTQQDGRYPAREFHLAVADHWIEEYHVDGFRIDEFKGINNWDFVQEFRDRAWATHQAAFPGRPFIVIAEDSWRRSQATRDEPSNPNRRKVVDAIWSFSYRDEARRLLHNDILTVWGEPARTERVQALVSGRSMWDEFKRQIGPGFSDLAQAVIYITSHDTQDPGEWRYMNEVLAALLQAEGWTDTSTSSIREFVAGLGQAPAHLQDLYQQALDRAGSAFALLLTSVGIPMFLAGEEFGDIHDLHQGNWRLKMSDPVDWSRRNNPGNAALWQRVRDLVDLRASHPALQRNEVDFFYRHPELDHDGGARVFAYCRTGGQSVGRSGQVNVVVNGGPSRYPVFDLPWPWTAIGSPQERGVPLLGGPATFRSSTSTLRLSLEPFQVRVFSV
jgi:1,4-alpha-glucan branching enzyme